MPTTPAPQLQEIPAGWTVAVVNPDGVVVDSLDIECQDLRMPLAAADLAENVARIVENAERDRT